MNQHKLVVVLAGAALMLSVAVATAASAQERPTIPKEAVEAAKRAAAQPAGKAPSGPALPAPLGCQGPITKVIDTGYEDLKFTPAVYGTNPGGGEGGQFDRTPVLSTRVTLAAGT